MNSTNSASQPVPFAEFSDLGEAAKTTLAVQLTADRVETFGFLLGREMSAIGSGHSERSGGPGHVNDRWLASVSPEGWVAVVAVEDVRPKCGLGHLSVRILSSELSKANAAEHLAQLVKRVRRAESEAKTSLGSAYAWGIALGPLGDLQALDERARHRFGGRYELHDVTLSPLAAAYEDITYLADGLHGEYRVHRAWASGSVTAPTWEIAQRLADRKALDISLFLSLLLRTAIEPAQSAACVVQGDATDLAHLFPRNLISTPGTQESPERAFEQNYGPTAPRDAPHVYTFPNDAADLWRKMCSLHGSGQRFWEAMAAYRTASKLRFQFPSLSFVALVSAVEGLIDTATLPKCDVCDQYTGVGKAFEALLVMDGPEHVQEAKFARDAYNTRSRIVHDASLYGGEMMSRVGRPGGGCPARRGFLAAVRV